MGMFDKEWTAIFEGHRIRVRNHWFKGVDLFIDDGLRAHSNQIIAVPGDPPLISMKLRQNDPHSPLLEVYVASITRTLAAIVIDGRKIAGDLEL